jgi:hypothetical protein
MSHRIRPAFFSIASYDLTFAVAGDLLCVDAQVRDPVREAVLPSGCLGGIEINVGAS